MWECLPRLISERYLKQTDINQVAYSHIFISRQKQAWRSNHEELMSIHTSTITKKAETFPKEDGQRHEDNKCNRYLFGTDLSNGYAYLSHSIDVCTNKASIQYRKNMKESQSVN